MASNYYDVLGLHRDASKAQIKAAYRRLALKYHPDKNPGNSAAQSRFVEISNAYQILYDSERRARYDHGLDEGDMEAFKRYWEQVKPEKPPPPPPYYYSYAREKIVYSPQTYFLGGLTVAGIVALALLIPFFLLKMSSEQNYQKAIDSYQAQQYTTALHYLDLSMSEFSTKNAQAATLAGTILTYKLKNHDYALKYIEKGFDHAEDDSLQSELQYLKGLCYYNKGQPSEAIRAFESVGNGFYKKDSALFLTGLVYATQKQQPAESLKYFTLLLDHNPDFNEARYYRALSLQKLEKHGKAIDDLKHLISMGFEAAAVYYHKARSEIARDQMDDACFDLKMAMRYQLEEARSLYALYCVDSLSNEEQGSTGRISP